MILGSCFSHPLHTFILPSGAGHILDHLEDASECSRVLWIQCVRVVCSVVVQRGGVLGVGREEGGGRIGRAEG